MPADTAASLRQEQSNEKVKSWWTKVTGFPKGSGRFQVRDALKKCSPTNFSKCKEKHGAWRLKFAECNGSSDSTQIIHQCDQNFNDSQMYISAVIFPLVFMFSVRRQMSPVSVRRVAFVFRDFPIGFI